MWPVWLHVACFFFCYPHEYDQINPSDRLRFVVMLQGIEVYKHIPELFSEDRLAGIAQWIVFFWAHICHRTLLLTQGMVLPLTLISCRMSLKFFEVVELHKFSLWSFNWPEWFFRFQQSSVSLNSIGFAVIRKGCLRLRCYAIGDAGRLNDPLKDNKNGPVLQGLNGSAASFRTVGAEITPETGDFFVSDAEGDPDKPTEGFSAIEDAINSLRDGKVRENKYLILYEQKNSFLHACNSWIWALYLIMAIFDITCKMILQRYPNCIYLPASIVHFILWSTRWITLAYPLPRNHSCTTSSSWILNTFM